MHRHIGIYAGTFDPIHDGHIALAEAAVNEARLDTIFFLPEVSPRNKKSASNIFERIELIKEVSSGNPKLDVLVSEENQFTVTETLPKLQSEFPASKLSFLIGSDVLEHLHSWDGISDLLNSAALIIGLRGDDSVKYVEDKITELENQCGLFVRYYVVSTEHKDVSSTKIKLAR